jgi:uncharacterized protein with PQ loop repeat
MRERAGTARTTRVCSCARRACRITAESAWPDTVGGVFRDILMVFTTAVGLVMAVPQLLRLLRTRQTSGMSLPGWVSGSVSYLAWSGYLAVQHQTHLLLATAVPAVVWIATTALASRLPRVPIPRRAWRPTVLWSVLLLGLTATAPRLGLAPLGTALALSVVWSYGPQAWQAWRSDDLTGLSSGTWSLAVLEAVTFGMLGWPDAAAGVYAVVASGLAGTVLAAAWMRRNPIAAPTGRGGLPA